MAPIIIPMACASFIIPEFTNPTTITVVAEEDWITAVTTVPNRIPFIRLEVSRPKMVSSLLPATFFIESPISDMPNRKNASPPKSEMMDARFIARNQTFRSKIVLIQPLAVMVS